MFIFSYFVLSFLTFFYFYLLLGKFLGKLSI
nr:MAG TPA: hypothetical protein [Caudoviricetes sp.]DAP53428.1 MAG TPA: hypothetical protein [Caudoviricetes sp.]DAP54716.1 MAG TPA: hypothetical protein [Caudoviricetes sp.]DAU05057.1 MAG TPA: hypothetical protein [Caudoviricetes sp.]